MKVWFLQRLEFLGSSACRPGETTIPGTLGRVSIVGAIDGLGAEITFRPGREAQVWIPSSDSKIMSLSRLGEGKSYIICETC